MQAGGLDKRYTIHTLPPEILVQVLSYLDVTSLCKASAVCKDWHYASNHSQGLWKTLCDELEDRKEYIMRDKAMGHSWKVDNYFTLHILQFDFNFMHLFSS